MRYNWNCLPFSVSRFGLILDCLLQTVSNLWSIFLYFSSLPQTTCHPLSNSTWASSCVSRFPICSLAAVSKQATGKQECSLGLSPCPSLCVCLLDLLPCCAHPDHSCMPVFPLPGCQDGLQVQQQGRQSDAQRSSTAKRLRTVLKIITFSVARMTEVASGRKEDRKKILVELVKNFLTFSMSTSQNEAAREKGAISASLLI